MLFAALQSWRSLDEVFVDVLAEMCGICAAGAGIVAQYNIVVVELPEHFQAIEDALPLGIDALGLNIGCVALVRFIVHSLSSSGISTYTGIECGERESITFGCLVWRKRFTFIVIEKKRVGRLPREFFALRCHKGNGPFYINASQLNGGYSQSNKPP
jgi:hypothetical protein